MRYAKIFAISFFWVLLLSAQVLALTGPADEADRGSAASRKSETGGGIGVGVGFKTSTLGIGFDVATRLSTHANARVGFNTYSYGRDFTNNGIGYNGTLDLRSVNALLDLFPFGGGFHVSPGALIYNGNQVTATGSVPAGQTFSLGGVTYRSNLTNPVGGTGKLELRKAAPMVMIGWGNLIPRNKHFSASFEVGAVFQGEPKTTLNLTGSACDPTGLNCRNVATDPTVQSNIQAQQDKINKDVEIVKYYPVVSAGFGFRF
jgi:hypothetical protein